MILHALAVIAIIVCIAAALEEIIFAPTVESNEDL
jgi:hypothetical protein